MKFLKANNQDLINNLGNLTTLSQKGAENLEKSLESLAKKIHASKASRRCNTKRLGYPLALVTSLKGVLGNMSDEDIEINVEKGVAYVFPSQINFYLEVVYNNAAKAVLGKVAKVINDKPEPEFMVEGHTDNVPLKEGTQDNWTLGTSLYASTFKPSSMLRLNV